MKTILFLLLCVALNAQMSVSGINTGDQDLSALAPKASPTFTGTVTLPSGQALIAPALGTPASGTLTSCTGLPIATGISGLASNVATFLATPSSANLRAALTDESGTGAALFAGGNIGAASGTSLAATGLLTSSGTAGVGYATGAGGTVTQLTSRTTGVTLNKITGAITLFAAAGSASYNTLTVTNSTVAATDTIVLSVKSGTNVYLVFVTAVAAGSFNITFNTTGGTASDSPVINFAVIKAVAA